MVLLTLVCAVSYTFEITFGLAGTILMLLVMPFFIDSKTLVIYSALPQILVAAIGLIRSPKTVHLGFLLKMFAFAAFGGVFGLYLFYYLSSETYLTLLASIITAFGLYLLLAPKTKKIHPVVARLMDTFSGASHALFGISGPITMTRLLASFDDKTVVRNYALAFFLGTNLFRVAGYLINQTITADIGKMMLYSAPFLIIVFWFANHLHFKVNELLFRRVVSWVILLGGISLLFR